jgi:predicted NBD/HSP70 family sugar kinase
MPAANRDLIRAINRYNILNAIRAHGRISRVEIAEITGQSRASVTNITAELIRDNQIVEAQTADPSRRGRRRIKLALNVSAAFVVGVKVSSFRISCAVTNMAADVLSSIILPVRIEKRSVEFVADLIEEGIRHCIAGARLRPEQISGIGIGVPGFVDSEEGFCYWTPLYQRGVVHLRELVRQRLSIDCFLENDANAVTMAHQWFGEGRDLDDFLVITLEDGVGMGIVVNGNLYRGARGIGAEFGHMVIEPDGKPCRCGKKGCIETYVSDFSLVAEAKAAAANGQWSWPENRELTVEDVTEAALRGEPALREIFRHGGEILGRGVAALIQIFGPRRIIISGEGVRAGDLMFQPMKEAIAQCTNIHQRELAEIVIEKWRDTDWARGAASLVLQEIYRFPFDRIRPQRPEKPPAGETPEVNEREHQGKT